MFMQRLFSMVLVSAALVSASAISLWNGTQLVDATIEASSPPDIQEGALFRPELAWDCKGSTLCWSLANRDCDTAARFINVDNIYTTKGVAPNAGVCFGHCGIFVQRPACTVTGEAMRDGYESIRAFGCKKCGSEHQDDGCLITVNYVTGC